MQIKEVIVVEGRDDEANIKHFVDAEIIITHGYGLNKRTLERIQYAAETVGVIVFTDPDFVGNMIRERVSKAINGKVKHAFISRLEGTKDGNIGVENASEEAILSALKGAKAEVEEATAIYTVKDMHHLGLVGDVTSKAKRVALGKHFRIGYANGKQFLNRLNKYRIDPNEVASFLEKYEEEHE